MSTHMSTGRGRAGSDVKCALPKKQVSVGPAAQEVRECYDGQGWHIIRIEDVMLDLRVKRLERSRSQSSLALDLGTKPCG